ncbi:hypothetical protein ABN028_08425 [Actinopolymorpha sp. B17G11]|uniref:hypothetical protein n=1 Tax=Actinopolymorpha sp. B17G11 TaxID=3160861 RepID=UPI0032E38387
MDVHGSDSHCAVHDAGSTDAASNGAEFALGHQRVDDVGDGGAFVVGELVEVGEAGVDVAAGGVERSSLGVVDEQVVDA